MKRSKDQIRMNPWDFPGGPGAKTLHSQCRGPRFDPKLGSDIPRAATKTQHSWINEYKIKKKKSCGIY